MLRKTVIALLAVVLIGVSPTVASARGFGFHGFGGGGWHGGGWGYRGFGGWGLGAGAFASAVIRPGSEAQMTRLPFILHR